MSTAPYLETAVRVWTSLPDDDHDKADSRQTFGRYRYALVLDTETTTDAAQRLNFGSYRYVRLIWEVEVPSIVMCEEGLLFADDLPERDPGGYQLLVEYHRTREADLGSDFRRELRLRSEQDFLKVLWQEAIRKRSLERRSRSPGSVSGRCTDPGSGLDIPLAFHHDSSVLSASFGVV